MIGTITITEKSFGPKSLYKNLKFSIDEKEKIGIIGRNGVGKSTLFGILNGTDQDYTGEITFRRGVSVVSSRQEHHAHDDKSVIEYILGDLPEFSQLSHIIDTYPETMGVDENKIATYTDALQRFSDLGYYTNEQSIVEDLKRVQIDEAKAHAPLRELSGGQKRMVEVIKIMHSNAHLALVDEPTNHMDYIAKEHFIEWMNAAKSAMLIITHDRDVLHHVDKIIEIKDGQAVIYRGNYDHYLRQNASSTSNAMHEFEVVQRKIVNMKDKVTQFQRLKEKARDPDTIRQFKRREEQTRAELKELEAVEKPTFWIDKSSAADLGLKSAENYGKYKAANIRISGSQDIQGHSRLLVDVENLSLGYNQPLFDGISFQLREGERVELRGRNGAGKTTLIKEVIAVASQPNIDVNEDERPQKFQGSISVDSKVTIGRYEQEVSTFLFKKKLSEAIEYIYLSRGLSITTTRVRQLLHDYLFTPGDGEIPVSQLSGGQKARLQLIAMMAVSPNLLILDEPTNHLDLPSIEELENTLASYKGAVLFVSHDSYFQKNMGGSVVNIG